MPSFDRDSEEALIVRAVLRMARRLRVETSSGTISGSALGLLNTLHRVGPMSAVALAEAEGLAPQSLTRLLARLEDARMIDRTPDREDRRNRIISLTSRGRQELRSAIGERRKWLAEALVERLNEEERATLTAAAELMLRLAS